MKTNALMTFINYNNQATLTEMSALIKSTNAYDTAKGTSQRQAAIWFMYKKQQHQNTP